MKARPIKSGALAALLAVLLAIGAPSLSARAAENWEDIPPNPDIGIEYLSADSKFDGVRQALIQYKILERLQRFFAPLHMPHHLQLRTKQCGYENAFYSSADWSITLCYEEVAGVVLTAPTAERPSRFVSRDQAIFGGLAGIMLHESGHMMFDTFDVPRFGREEDAADEMSAFLALQASKDITKSIIIGFEYSFYVTVAKGAETSGAPMRVWADEHGSSSQRVYNILCLAYGADPDQFKQFVDRGWLPKARAAGCADEYSKVKQAFEQTIAPSIDPVLMARVRTVQWLPAGQAQVGHSSGGPGPSLFPHPEASQP